MIASKGDSKMSGRRVKTSGWAAFDQKQRQNDKPEAQPNTESFPSLPNTMRTSQSAKTIVSNKHLRAKSFSSVIQPSVDYSAILQDNMKNKRSIRGNSDIPQIGVMPLDNKIDMVSRQLKELFSWADDSLIDDIMAAAGNDFDKASSFLSAMVSDQSSLEDKDVGVANDSCDPIEFESTGKFMHEKKDVSFKEISDSDKMCSHVNNIKNVANGFTLSAENLFNDCKKMDAMLGQLTCVPIEPEWEEDDVYLSCRKDAIKMIRAASNHSKAASNAFLRGDHINAQKFSLKAREEWSAAQGLNAKAANEILSIRNENNGIWKLDLHGLHASEAVQAVKEHLCSIEIQMLAEGARPPELPNSFRYKAEACLDGCSNLEKSNDWASHRLRPMWLEVITGVGNHSRGGAALPTAVRTFLSDNGYRYDEPRPGVVMVRPKFRVSGMP